MPWPFVLIAAPPILNILAPLLFVARSVSHIQDLLIYYFSILTHKHENWDYKTSELINNKPTTWIDQYMRVINYKQVLECEMTFCQALTNWAQLLSQSHFYWTLVGNVLLILIQNMTCNMLVEMLFVSTIRCCWYHTFLKCLLTSLHGFILTSVTHSSIYMWVLCFSKYPW